MKTGRFVMAALLLAAALAVAAPATAQFVITPTQVAPGVWVIHTQTPISMGGPGRFSMNNLLLPQADGAILVDTLFPGGLGAYFIGTIHGVTGGIPVKTLINTSWHFDHIGLNNLFRSVEGTDTVLAHHKIGEYISTYPCSGDAGPCQPPFTDPLFQPTQGVFGGLTINLPNETILLKTLEHAHAGADLFVYLRQANVIYTGDIYFGGIYPIIDRSGGSLNGTLAALHKVLALTDDNTIVVPSHGAIGNRQSVVEFVNMLETTRSQVQLLIDEGCSEAQVVNDPSFAALDARWGANAFITGPFFRTIVYRDIVSHQ